MTPSQHQRLVQRVEGVLVPLIYELDAEAEAARSPHGSISTALRDLALRENIESHRKRVMHEVIKLQSWCSPAQRELLALVTEISGVHLDEQITCDDARLYLAVLRDPDSPEHRDEVPL